MGVPNKAFIANAAAVLIVTGVFLILSYFLLNAVLKERKVQGRELSRAKCLVEIVEILNLVEVPVREKIKRVGRILAEEGDRNGWRCRIVVQDDPLILPPSGKKLGFHVPMTVTEKTVGTLIVSAPEGRLGAMEESFFESVAGTLGPFLYKENLWDEFHGEVSRLQAALLLHTDVSPSEPSTENPNSVESMLRMLGVLSGKVENSVDNKL